MLNGLFLAFANKAVLQNAIYALRGGHGYQILVAECWQKNKRNCRVMSHQNQRWVGMVNYLVALF